MKLFKSLLLGSAAGLVAVSGASAADLGVRKPTAAVEYVRVCSAHGAGFFYIPGSDVCMQISGRVRAEYLTATTFSRTDDLSSFRANGRVNFDVRQTTQYGLLRTFIRYDVYGDGGRYAGLAGPGNQNNFLLDKAFIQFYTGTSGFFTAGRSASFFDFYANDSNYSVLPGSDAGRTNLFAYTFTFGGGLTATISVEDAYVRRAGLAAFSTVGFPVGTIVPGTGIAYLGQRSPDIVGNIRMDQAWGSAQLSGALHHVEATNVVGIPAFGAFPGAAAGTLRRNDWGWAIQGGLKINLPMIAAGDHLWLQAAYGQGAVSYAGVGNLANNTSSFGPLRAITFSGDGYINAVGQLKRANAWSVVGAFVHNFTPTIQGAVYGGYGEVDYPSSSAFDYKTYAVGGRLNWIPVRGFTIGTEVMYSVLDPKSRIGIAGVVAPKGKYDTVTARLRFQRDF